MFYSVLTVKCETLKAYYMAKTVTGRFHVYKVCKIKWSSGIAFIF